MKRGPDFKKPPEMRAAFRRSRSEGSTFKEARLLEDPGNSGPTFEILLKCGPDFRSVSDVAGHTSEVRKREFRF